MREQENMRRTEQILACQDNLRELKQTLQRHQQEWKHQFAETSLRRIGLEAWFQLDPKERNNKTNVLILLEYDPKVPQVTCGGNFWSNLPNSLKNNRDLLLAKLRRPHFVQELGGMAFFFLPDSLRDDVEVVTAAVRAYPIILLTPFFENPGAYNRTVLRALFQAESFEHRDKYLKLFSVELRSDTDLMLEALGHGIRVFEVLPKQLRNSRTFALQAAAVIRSHSTKFNYGIKCLKLFSQQLKSDLEVVQAFCQCDGGTSLACASYAARRNLETVQIACQQDPTALLHCLKGSTRTHLIHNKSFWMQILSRAEPSSDDCVNPVNAISEDKRMNQWDRLWDMLPRHLQTDSDIALRMLQRSPPNSLYLKIDAPSLLGSKPFLIEVAAIRRLHSIPIVKWINRDLLTIDMEFCCAILSKEMICPGVVAAFLETFPYCCSNRQFWECLNPCQFEESLDLIFEAMPDDIGNDKEIMLKFSKCEKAASQVTMQLWESLLVDDRDVLENLVSIHPEAFAELPTFLQVLYPDLVVKCIENTPFESDTWEDLQEYIDDTLLSNRDVAMALIRKGVDEPYFLTEHFPDDEEIFLAVAEHNWDEFDLASEDLLANKEFLTKAVSINGRVWTLLDDVMQEDFDIALAAFAGFPDLPYHCVEARFRFVITFARKIRSELEIHDSFVQLILCSVDASSSRNVFAKLNQGHHTALQYKKTIAEYIGLPMGDYLLQLKRASEHLALWCF